MTDKFSHFLQFNNFLKSFSISGEKRVGKRHLSNGFLLWVLFLHRNIRTSSSKFFFGGDGHEAEFDI